MTVYAQKEALGTRNRSMHYERAPRFRRSKVGEAPASAALRYAGLRSAAAAHAILHDPQHLSALVLPVMPSK
jgi:hypothetical protein